MQHLLSAHPNFKFDFKNDMRKLCYNYPEKVLSAYKWIDWIVMDDLPFDNERTRNNASIKSISRQTLTKNLSQLTKLLENEVRASLPSCFGLIIDAWSHNSTSYFGVASYRVNNVYPLLSFSPILDETSHSASNYCEFIKLVIEEVYFRKIGDVLLQN